MSLAGSNLRRRQYTDQCALTRGLPHVKHLIGISIVFQFRLIENVKIESFAERILVIGIISYAHMPDKALAKIRNVRGIIHNDAYYNHEMIHNY